MQGSQHVSGFFSLRGKAKVLHATTTAFFLSFVVWFDAAPFLTAIGKDLHLSKAVLTTVLLCNLALTVPARLVVGMLLDVIGPRRLYAGLLIGAAIPNTVFATAHDANTLIISRLFVGIIGAGFVVGIRLVAEWYEEHEMGAAQGLYGGWGNFGSAGAALLLPTIATSLASGPGAWRWGVATAGFVAAGYGIGFLLLVPETAREKRATKGLRSLEVARRADVLGLALLQAPIALAMALVIWRIHRVKVIGDTTATVLFTAAALMLAWQVTNVLRSNQRALKGTFPAQDAFPFRAVVLLCLAYFVTFGTELAVVGLLPTFFAATFGLKIVAASAAGSAFAFTNLVTRPGGGAISDRVRRRKAVVIACLVGTAVCFAGMTQLDRTWPLAAGIGLVALASVFVQGGNGAVFAMVPLVQRRIGGQVAGLAGAYGSVGGIALSSLLFFSANKPGGTGDVALMFGVVAAGAALVALLCRWLPEPVRGQVFVPTAVRVKTPAWNTAAIEA